MDIGKQIKTLRLAKGVTQEELAAYLGVSFQAVSKWETESSTPAAKYCSIFWNYNRRAVPASE